MKSEVLLQLVNGREVAFLPSFGELLKGRVQIVRNKKIQVSVAVVIDPRTTRAVMYRFGNKAGALCDICKGSVSIISIENVLTVIRNENVIKSIINLSISLGSRVSPVIQLALGMR